jgi:hypothetical protein
LYPNIRPRWTSGTADRGDSDTRRICGKSVTVPEMRKPRREKRQECPQVESTNLECADDTVCHDNHRIPELDDDAQLQCTKLQFAG